MEESCLNVYMCGGDLVINRCVCIYLYIYIYIFFKVSLIMLTTLRPVARKSFLTRFGPNIFLC